MENGNILEIKNLRKVYGADGVAGAKNVSFNLPRGYIMGFVGKNGAGKTTTIKAILNMVKRDDGEIKIFGLDNIENEAEVKQRIGVVLDKPFHEQNWTLERMGKVLKPFYKNWSDERYHGLLRDFGLDKAKKVKELSRGMGMKFMMACALAHDPDFLILDEPTGGLDAVARDELVTILQNFVSDDKKSILFSTHITSDLEKIADYITFINNGVVVHSDTKDNLLEKYVIVKGGLGILTEAQKEMIIGYSETKVNFDGMVERGVAKKFPKEVLTEACTLDEIVVRFNKDKKGGAR